MQLETDKEVSALQIFINKVREKNIIKKKEDELRPDLMNSQTQLNRAQTNFNHFLQLGLTYKRKSEKKILKRNEENEKTRIENII